MKVRLIALCILGISFCSPPKLYAQKEQPELLHPHYAKFVKRIDSITQLQRTDFPDAELSGLYWQMAITQYYPQHAKLFLIRQVQRLYQLSAGAQLALIEVVSSMSDSTLLVLIWQQHKALRTTKAKVAIDALYGRIVGVPTPSKTLIPEDDSLWRSAAGLSVSYGQSTVEIASLLDTQFLPGEYVYISLQHRNRDIAGELRVRTPEGQWLRTSSNELVRFPQLARSITNLPFCITNGHTPQGLYKVGSVAISDNAWIGTTPNLQLALPFEQADTPFFKSTGQNRLVEYGSFLASLARYPNLWESYYAGAIGRSEIIAHGTAIPTQWYNSQAYKGFTPSMGCLCMPEVWHSAAKPTVSEQEAFIALHQSLPQKPQYLLVVNVW